MANKIAGTLQIITRCLVEFCCWNRPVLKHNMIVLTRYFHIAWSLHYFQKGSWSDLNNSRQSDHAVFLEDGLENLDIKYCAIKLNLVETRNQQKTGRYRKAKRVGKN